MAIKNFLFKNTGLKQTIAKNTFWLTLAEVIARSFSLFLVIYLARILGANEYGKFTFALSFALLVSIFSDLGIVDISTREFSRNRENEQKFNSIFTLGTFLGLLTFLAAVVSSFFITNDFSIQKMIWILTIFVLISNLFGIFFSFLRARQKMEYEAIAKISQAFINIFVIFFIITYFPTAINVSYGYLFSSLIIFLLLFIFFVIYFQPIQLKPQKNIFNILKISWPLSIGLMPAWIYISLNSIILGYFNLITENGWYNAASRIAIAAMIIINLIVRSFYPVLSNLFFTQKEQIKKAWGYLAESVVFLIMPIMVGGIVLAPRVINSFYGEGFSPSILALQFLMVVVAISFINYPYTLILVVSDYQKQNFILILLGGFINIILSFIFIYLYGFYGVIIATIIASLIVLFLTIFLSAKNNIIIPFGKKFLKTASIASIAGFLMYVIISNKLIYNSNVFLVCALGGLAYTLFFLLLYKLFFAQSFFIFGKKSY